jgi:hypothetical protein
VIENKCCENKHKNIEFEFELVIVFVSLGPVEYNILTIYCNIEIVTN